MTHKEHLKRLIEIIENDDLMFSNFPPLVEAKKSLKESSSANTGKGGVWDLWEGQATPVYGNKKNHAFNSIDDVIRQWVYIIDALDKLMGNTDKGDDMFCILISRKNQLVECINNIKSIQNVVHK